MEQLRRLRRQIDRSEAAASAPAAVEVPAAQAAPATDTVRDVQVIYGASVQTLALAGLTVAQARPLVETILAVDPRSPVLVNGRPARASYLIAQGDALEFVHHAGEKGRTGWNCESRSWRTRSFAVRTEPGRLALP